MIFLYRNYAGTTAFEEEAVAAAAADKAAAAVKDTSSVAATTATTSETVVVESRDEKVDPSKVARTSSTATSISRGRDGITTSTATTATTSTASSPRTGVVSAAMPSSTAAALQAAALANSGAARTTASHRQLDYTVNDKVEKLETKLVKVEKEGKTETAERIEAKIAKYIQDPTYIDPATVVTATAATGTATGEKPAKEAVDPKDAKTDKTVAVPAETLTEIPSVPVADGHHAASEERTEGTCIPNTKTCMMNTLTHSVCGVRLYVASSPLS